MRYEPIAADDFCKTPIPGNNYCRYPAALCPLHENRFNSGPQPPNPPERWLTPGPGERPLHETNRNPDTRKDPRDAAQVIRQVIEALETGDASPLQVQRLVRALQAIEKLQSNRLTEDEILAESALQGVLMCGLSPFDQAQWDLAQRVYNDEGLAILIMSAKHNHCPYPRDLDERLGHPAISNAHFERTSWNSGLNRDTRPPFDDPLNHDPVELEE